MCNTRPAAWRRALWLAALTACAGCSTFGERGKPLVPTRYQTRTGPFAVYSNFPIAPDAPAIRCLMALETDVEATLGVHVAGDAPPVEVYILDDRPTYEHFLRFHYPDLPVRRAFFLAQARRVVYTFQGDRLEEDLRHEATHAFLNVAIGDLPLWLDEGLAEFFEGPDGRRGLNPEHLSRLPGDVALGWAPDLPRLEGMTKVAEMTTRDYRESWAWVHYLLTGPEANKAVLIAYLAELRASPATAKPISERLPAPSGAAAPGALMLAHVQKLRAQPLAAGPAPAVAAPSAATVRLQDIPEPAQAAQRPSFFGRVRTALGL